MKNIISVFVLIVLASSVSVAQQQGKSDRIGFGISQITLDLPDDVTFLPKVSYQHKFSNRLFASADLGYLSYHSIDNEYSQIPRIRRRLTLDLAGKFSLVKYRDNHLRLAFGPSAWRRDDLVVEHIRLENGQVTSYDLVKNRDWNLGYNAGIELDINLSRRLSVMGNFQIANLGRSGWSNMIGVTGLYRLR